LNIEKGDVDLSKLFHWGKQFEITDRFGKKVMDVYLRLVGDAELNRARIFAIRKSSELRKKLKEENSEERLVFIPDLDENKQDLIDRISVLKIKEFTQAASKEVSIPLPKEPKSDAPLEEIEQYQEKVDRYSEIRMDAIQNNVRDRLGVLNISLTKEDISWLKKEYERLIINELCEQEMVKKFRDSCAYYGSFRDENYTYRLFNTFDDFDNLPTLYLLHRVGD
jgi:hypothetical protein